MKNNLTVDEIIELIFRKLNAGGRLEAYNSIDLKRVTDKSDLIDKLKVRMNNGNLTDNIFEYLLSYSHSKIDGEFYKHINDKILPTVTLNPHDKPNLFKPYFVKEDTNGRLLTHLDELFYLSGKDKNKKDVRLIKSQNILHIGEKGSGKTLSQNFWLYESNDKLEDSNIVWVRLDASKLIKIWKKGNALLEQNDTFLITPEMYMLGQLVYVFSKHFQKEFSNLYSKLFGEIADKLEVNSANNLQNYSVSEAKLITKAHARSINVDMLIVSKFAEKEKITTIIDFLRHFERVISISEFTFADNGKTRRDDKEKTNKDYSFMVDNVLLDSQKQRQPTELFKVWIAIAKILQEFIISNNYKILYIIDGLDNINFYHEERENYLNKLLELLYDFPLTIGHRNELLLISLRDTTYNRLKKIGKQICYIDRSQYKKLETFSIIRQQTNNVLKNILDKRINYIFSDGYTETSCFMARVLKTIKESNIIDHLPEEETWHFNIRGFLYNNITLAKYVTFKYYSAGQPLNFGIGRLINIYKDINLLLNGHLYICEEMHPPNTNEGGNYFNLFGYTIGANEESLSKNEEPLYFIYTYILLLIKKHEPISMKRIFDILTRFGNISKIDCRKCIDKLVSSGMIKQELSSNEDNMEYKKTIKGILALRKFYNDIHFLYYTSLDTKIPEKLLKSFKIAPNNTYSNRNYPPYCIITGINFLKYLKCQNNKILKDIELKNKLNELKIDISIFKLPIEKSELSKSIETMVKIIMREENENYRQILADWLDHKI